MTCATRISFPIRPVRQPYDGIFTSNWTFRHAHRKTDEFRLLLIQLLYLLHTSKFSLNKTVHGLNKAFFGTHRALNDLTILFPDIINLYQGFLTHPPVVHIGSQAGMFSEILILSPHIQTLKCASDRRKNYYRGRFG